jgi:hypothetical protein
LLAFLAVAALIGMMVALLMGLGIF